MAGMLFSNVILHDGELKKAWNFLVGKQLGLFMPHALSITAVQAAYDRGDEWLEQVIDYLDGNFAFLGEFLERNLPEARYTPPEGTYLAWIDLRAFGREQDLLEGFVSRGRVLVEGGSMFGPGGEGFIRLNAACSRSLLKEALERISGVLTA